MLSRLRTFFSERLAPGVDDDPQHRRHLAAAALLIEIARADFRFDDEEQGAIRRVLGDTLDLTEEEVSQIVELATAESRDATSLHQFTRLVNESHDIEEKRRLMEDLVLGAGSRIVSCFHRNNVSGALLLASPEYQDLPDQPPLPWEIGLG